MTLTLKFNNDIEIHDFMAYMNELYEFIDINKEEIPGAITTYENTMVIYTTDEFFNYCYKFVIENLLMKLNGLNSDKDRMQELAKNFREGAKDMLMHLISAT